MTLLHSLGLGLIGVAVGTFGTLIGAGGGFLLLPLLLFLYPHDSAAVLSGISLAVVFVNAASGSAAYARMGRVDVRAGLLFAAAGLPGAILGAMVTQHLDRAVFDPVLGGVLLLGGALVLFRPVLTEHLRPVPPTRRLVERDGTVHEYAPRVALGMLLSLGVGFISSLLGIGGGIIHVPAMVLLLGFPTHIATATSHFVLAILALAGVLVHVRSGSFAAGLPRTLPLAGGVLIGAQIGAWWSSHIHGRWILRALGVALASVGLRLLLVR